MCERAVANNNVAFTRARMRSIKSVWNATDRDTQSLSCLLGAIHFSSRARARVAVLCNKPRAPLETCSNPWHEIVSLARAIAKYRGKMWRDRKYFEKQRCRLIEKLRRDNHGSNNNENAKYTIQSINQCDVYKLHFYFNLNLNVLK